jgi:UDP-glucose 4-epimerase
MKYLITGGAGFIGSHIVQHFLDRGSEVTCLDNFDPGYDIKLKKLNISPFFQHKGFEFVEGDVRDQNLLKKIVQDTECIFHEAAQVSVVESMKDPVRTIEINTIGTFNILNAALESNVKKVIIASSAAVYGDSPDLPKKENMTPSPRSPYAISKLDNEYAAMIFHYEYGLNTTVLRYFNVFGPRQDPTSQYAAVIPIFIKRALRNESIEIYGDGSQTRDFIFVKDVAYANELVMSKGEGRIFNVANGNSISIIELAERIKELTDSSSKIIYQDPRIGDIKHSLADITEIRKIGFRPKFDLDKGLIDTINGFRKKADLK